MTNQKIYGKRVKRVSVNGKLVVISKVCPNCRTIIEKNKGICETCFALKLKGENVKLKWEE